MMDQTQGMLQRDIFSIKRKVFYDFTDAGGVMYHANYLSFMDHARSECLSHHGFEISELARVDNIVFAVRDIAISYRFPARLGDILMITAKLVETGKSKMLFKQTILRQNLSDAEPLLLSEATVALVCLNAEKFKPCSIPQKIKEIVNSAY